MDIKNVFDASPKSTYHLLCGNGLGFYIPAYQREYAWDKEKITRLFEDAGHGLKLLLRSDDAITFIGTIITIHDTKYQTVSPQATGELPSKVMIVIDGQQRMTTLLLMNSILHEEIRIRSKKFLNDSEEEAYHNIRLLSLKVIADLSITFEEQKPYGDEEYKWYPRIIRAYDDSWAPYAKDAIYSSPIAKYIHKYSQHTRSKDSLKKYNHTITDSKEGKRPKHQILAANIKTIRSIVNKEIAQVSNKSTIEMPSVTEIASNDELQETLFGSVLSPDFRDILNVLDPDKKQQHFQELTRILFFAKFALERMAVTVVTAKNEDYAFDMFEALNTTGEPLTAFETFKPRVINAVGLAEYKSSESRRYIKRIEKYLDAFKDAQKKQTATTALLVPFALSETGSTLSKRLSDQRRYLRDEFEGLGKEAQQNFVKRLSHTSDFIKNTWPNVKAQESIIDNVKHPELETALMCIDVLRQSNHNITIAPLSCFYSRVKTADVEQRDNAINDLIISIKAITAFFVLWRGSRQGTKGIDAHYRDLMRIGVGELGISPLAYNAPSINIEQQQTTGEKLQEALRYILKENGNITTKGDWIKSLNATPVYGNSRPLTRFLLLLASHDTRPMLKDNSEGLVEVARKGYLDMLNLKRWRETANMTIEHVAPQTSDQSWDEDMYTDPDFIHHLGNLALLPSIENASIGNKSWDEKKLFFKILSSETEDELESLLENCGDDAVKFGKSTEQILKDSRYLPHVKAISNVSYWNKELVEQRTRNLGGLVWQQLAPWLGY